MTSKSEINRLNKANNDYSYYRLTFGQHRGKFLREVPSDYLRWMVLNFNNIQAEWYAQELRRRGEI